MLSASPGLAEDIRLRGVSYVGDLPTHVIDRDGLLSNSRVALDFGKSGAVNLVDLRAGRVDVITVAMTPIVWDALRDMTPKQPDDPVILANLSSSQPLLSILSVSPMATRDPQSLYGQRIAVQFGTIAHYVLSLFFQVNRLDEDKVQLVNVEAADIPRAIAEGRAEAAALWEPWVSEIVDAHSGSGVVLYPSASLDMSRWLLVTRRDVLDRDPEAIDAILRAYIEASARINHDPEATVREIATRWSLTRGEARTLADGLLYRPTLDWSLFRSFREQLDWAADLGGYDASQATSFVDMTDARPLARLAPSAVRLPISASGGEE